MEPFTFNKEHTKMSINGCARCGKNHNYLEIKKFKKNPVRNNTHFAVCPNTKEPILIKILN